MIPDVSSVERKENCFLAPDITAAMLEQKNNSLFLSRTTRENPGNEVYVSFQPLLKREANWVELAFAKTSGTVIRDRVSKLADS